MDSNQLLVRAYRLINLYNSTQKKPHMYSCGLVMYPAQSHMIEIIGDCEGVTQTEIATEYMITKGAVSQIISFLEQNGLIIKKPSQKGGRSTELYLSDKGKSVFSEHRELHRVMTRRVAELADRIPPESIEILSQISDVIEENIRKM